VRSQATSVFQANGCVGCHISWRKRKEKGWFLLTYPKLVVCCVTAASFLRLGTPCTTASEHPLRAFRQVAYPAITSETRLDVWLTDNSTSKSDFLVTANVPRLVCRAGHDPARALSVPRQNDSLYETISVRRPEGSSSLQHNPAPCCVTWPV
jgi:hypothetical protein